MTFLVRIAIRTKLRPIVKVETRDDQGVFAVLVRLNNLDPNAVQVWPHVEGVMGNAPVREEMKRVRLLAGAAGGQVYSAAVSAVRPPAGYTARVIPHGGGIAIPR